MKTIKMKLFNILNVSAVLTLFTMASCKDMFDDGTKIDGSTPYEEITSPAAGSAYQASEPLRLLTAFGDKDGFKQIDVKFVRLADGAKGSESVVDFQRTPGVNQYKIDTTFAANTFTPGKYQMTIHSVDKRQNEGTKEVLFDVN